MPLVYGVCRTASAPTLSHGGSRLNASKPEANPKTRYPTNYTSQHPSSAVVCLGTCAAQRSLTVRICVWILQRDFHVVMTNQIGIRGYSRIVRLRTFVIHDSLLLFREFSPISGFSIESPHKPLPPARPRWRQVSHMITSYFSSHLQHIVVLSTHRHYL